MAKSPLDRYQADSKDLAKSDQQMKKAAAAAKRALAEVKKLTSMSDRLKKELSAESD